MKNNHIYNIVDDKTFKKDKNCYVITKYGSMSHPVICYKRNNDDVINENKVIGGYSELIEFLSDKENNKVYLRGFNKATIGRIFRLVLEKSTSKIIKQEVDKDSSKIVKTILNNPVLN